MSALENEARLVWLEDASGLDYVRESYVMRTRRQAWPISSLSRDEVEVPALTRGVRAADIMFNDAV